MCFTLVILFLRPYQWQHAANHCASFHSHPLTAGEHHAVLRNRLDMHHNMPQSIESECSSAVATRELEVYHLALERFSAELWD
jgi:hypothetical protein